MISNQPMTAYAGEFMPFFNVTPLRKNVLINDELIYIAETFKVQYLPQMTLTGDVLHTGNIVRRKIKQKRKTNILVTNPFSGSK